MVSERDRIFQVIAQSIQVVLPALQLHRFTRLDAISDFGADSVEKAEILTAIIEELKLNASNAELFGQENIGELVDFIYEKTAPSR